jgi:hypothetical protein
MGAEKSLARLGRKKARATEDFDFHLSYLQIIIGGILALSLSLSLSMYIYIYTECPRRNVPDFGRVFLMLKYTDIIQNTFVQS